MVYYINNSLWTITWLPAYADLAPICIYMWTSFLGTIPRTIHMKQHDISFFLISLYHRTSNLTTLLQLLMPCMSFVCIYWDDQCRKVMTPILPPNNIKCTEANDPAKRLRPCNINAIGNQILTMTAKCRFFFYFCLSCTSILLLGRIDDSWITPVFKQFVNWKLFSRKHLILMCLGVPSYSLMSVSPNFFLSFHSL